MRSIRLQLQLVIDRGVWHRPYCLANQTVGGHGLPATATACLGEERKDDAEARTSRARKPFGQAGFQRMRRAVEAKCHNLRSLSR